MRYPNIPNTEALDYAILDEISPDTELPRALTNPSLPRTGSKNIFAFWHSGIKTIPPYLLRNVIAWYRRYAPLGWNIFVVDVVPGSPLNVSCFIDTSDETVVPDAFRQGALNGGYAAQHTSDLTRYPLLLKYGGVYLDVGVLQFGDLDWLWTERIANPDSPYDFAGYLLGESPESSIVNFSLMCGSNNPLVARAHKILLALWKGKTNTTGMSSHALVNHIPLMRVPQEVVVDDEARERMVINDESMTDYAIQIQAMGSAQRWLDEEDGWNGPEYVREKAWLLPMIKGSMEHEQLTGWSGPRQHELLCLKLPKQGDDETNDQALARKIVEAVVGQSWSLKLGHGFSAKVFGADTLGILWRKHKDTDAKEGTYAGWLRWAQIHCRQVAPIEPVAGIQSEPTMVASLQKCIEKTR